MDEINENDIDLLERLVDVKKAIKTVLEGGQEYQIGNQKFKRADLTALYKLEKELTQRYNDSLYVHRAFIGWHR